MKRIRKFTIFTWVIILCISGIGIIQAQEDQQKSPLSKESLKSLDLIRVRLISATATSDSQPIIANTPLHAPFGTVWKGHEVIDTAEFNIKWKDEKLTVENSETGEEIDLSYQVGYGQLPPKRLFVIISAQIMTEDKIELKNSDFVLIDSNGIKHTGAFWYEYDRDLCKGWVGSQKIVENNKDIKLLFVVDKLASTKMKLYFREQMVADVVPAKKKMDQKKR